MSDTDEIKSRLNIEEVISEYIKLQPSGSGFKALCPFHNEKTPSFYVSADRGIFKCFGCGKSGDIFTFVQEYESLSFPEALKKLASKAGIVLQRNFSQENLKEKKKEERLYEVLEEISCFWHKKLLINQEAKEYLKKRGIDEEIVRTFRLGFAPESWDESMKYLLSKSYTSQELFEAGLIKEKEKGSGKYYDRFRNRIIFPIFNQNNSIIAFSGRDLSGNDKVAKYLNSPQTLLFDKSKTLYGFNFAKLEARKMKFFILTEGPMDMLMNHKIGFKNAVATQGTSLTDLHLESLKRFSDNLLFAFDSDKAGIEASFSGIKKALRYDFEIKLVDFSEYGKDPAELILSNPELYKKLISKSKNIIDFYFEKILKSAMETKEKIKELEEKVLPFVSEIANPILKGSYISKISSALEIKEDFLLQSLKILESKESYLKAEKKKNEEEKKSIQDFDILKKNTIIEQSKRKILKELSAIYWWQMSLPEKRKWLEPEKILHEVKKSSLSFFEKEILELEEEEKNQLILYAEYTYSAGGERNLIYVTESLFERIRKEISLKEKIKKLQESLFLAKEKEKKKILQELDKLYKENHHFK